MPAHNYPFPAFVDSTARKTWAACQQKWWYECIQCIGPARSNVHLIAGGTFARGLEVLRKSFYLHQRSLEQSLEDAKIAMLIEWGDYEPMFSWSSDLPPMGERRVHKTLDILLEAIDFYVSQWNPETDEVRPLVRNESISVEFSFAAPIPGTAHPETGDPILYAGRFDMLGVYDNVLYVVDEKTTSQLGPQWGNQWETRSQFTGYCWAAREYGYPVGGAIARGVSFLKNGFGSAQHITFRDDWRIQQWLLQLQKNVHDMIRVWEHADPDMNLDDSCSSFGGCSFQKLCYSPDPNIWLGDYVKRDWNPLIPST